MFSEGNNRRSTDEFRVISALDSVHCRMANEIIIEDQPVSGNRKVTQHIRKMSAVPLSGLNRRTILPLLRDRIRARDGKIIRDGLRNTLSKTYRRDREHGEHSHTDLRLSQS